MPITPPAGSRAEQNPNSVLLNLDRAQIAKILHYVHPIPVGKGFTREFLNKNHPGWELQHLMKWFETAEIISGHAMSSYKVEPKVAGLIVFKNKTFEVVWMTDDEWAAHLGEQAASSPLHREGGGRVLLPGSRLDLSSEEGIAKSARAIADQLLGDTPPPPPSRHRRYRA